MFVIFSLMGAWMLVCVCVCVHAHARMCVWGCKCFVCGDQKTTSRVIFGFQFIFCFARRLCCCSTIWGKDTPPCNCPLLWINLFVLDCRCSWWTQVKILLFPCYISACNIWWWLSFLYFCLRAESLRHHNSIKPSFGWFWHIWFCFSLGFFALVWFSFSAVLKTEPSTMHTPRKHSTTDP